MSGTYKTLKKTDIQVIPYAANKPWVVYSSSYASLGIKFWVGKNVTGSFIKATDPITTDLGSSETNYKRLVYSSIKQLYYSNYLSASYQIKTGSYDNFEQSTLVFLTPSSSYQQYHNPPTKYFPTASDSEIRVISIPRKIFGSKIVPGTFSIISTGSTSTSQSISGTQTITGALGGNAIGYTYADLGSSYFIGGDFTSWNNTSSVNGAFVNTNFTKTSLFVSFSGGRTREYVLDSNGKLYIVGDFASYNTSASKNIIRLNTNGTIDTAFNVGTGFSDVVYSIITSSISSSIYAAGRVMSYSGSVSSNIHKLNISDGKRDNTFTSSILTVGFAEVYKIIESGSKLYAGGSFITRNGIALNNKFIIRLNQGDGTLDSSFDVGTGFSNEVYSFGISGSRLYVGGNFTTYNGTSSKGLIALNSNASVDTSFNVGTGLTGSVGGAYSTTCYSILTVDGKIYVGGAFTAYNGTSSTNIIRLNGDGTIDTAFNVGTGFKSSVDNSLVINIKDSGSQVIVSGIFNNYSGSVSQSISVQPITGALGGAEAIFSLTITGSKYFIVGDFTSYNNTASSYGTFLNSDLTKSSLSVSFSGGTVYTSFMDNNGKIYVGGTHTAYNDTSSAGIIRLNGDGTVDTAFNVGVGAGGVYPYVYSIITSSISSSLYIGGPLTNYSGSTSSQIVKLNFDGTRDTTFQTSSLTGALVAALFNQIVESGSKLYGVGDFTTRNGTLLNNRRIMRLNQGDGTLDTSFDVGTGFNHVTRTAAISGSKLYVGGQFTTYDGTASACIVRLNSDGTRDATFNIGTGFTGSVSLFGNAYVISCIDGKIYVGGVFTAYNGTSSNNIIRLNTDGTVDTSFNVGTGFTGSISTSIVYSIVDSGSQVIIGGSFRTYSGSSCIQGLAVLNKADGTLVPPGIYTYTITTGSGVSCMSGLAVLNKADGTLVSPVTPKFVNTIISSSNNNNIYDDKEGNLFNFPVTQSITGALGNNNTVYTFGNLGSGYFIGGNYTSWNNTSSYNGAFTNTNFTKTSLLVSFSGGNLVNGIPAGAVLDSATDPYGRLYVAGNFVTYNATSSPYMVRLNSDGTIDRSFNVGVGFSNIIYSIATSSVSASIYAVGQSISYSGSSGEAYIIKLNLNGTKDTTFQSSSLSAGGGNSYALKVIESGSKIYVAGHFIYVNSVLLNNGYIVRLNGNGTIDSSFDVDTGFSIEPMALSISGSRLYVGGGFTSYNNTSSNRIVALNSNASIDTSFNVGTGFNTQVYDLNNIGGKLYVGGAFTSYKSTSSKCLVRLNGDGTVDTSFNVGTGFSGSSPIVYSIKDSGSQIIALGKFESYSGSSCMSGVAVINKADGTLVPPPAPSGQTLIGNILYPHGTAVITHPFFTNFLDTSSINDFTMSFKGEHIIQEHQITCHSTEEEFNYTLNPSVLAGTGSLADFATGSYFNPYITTVGLYNENKELLAVGKLSKPLPVPRNSDVTINLRYDT